MSLYYYQVYIDFSIPVLPFYVKLGACNLYDVKYYYYVHCPFKGGLTSPMKWWSTPGKKRAASTDSTEFVLSLYTSCSKVLIKLLVLSFTGSKAKLAGWFLLQFVWCSLDRFVSNEPPLESVNAITHKHTFNQTCVLPMSVHTIALIATTHTVCH